MPEIIHINHDDTVDGSNPAPVDKWFILFIPLFTGFHPKVVQDFFHPQYHKWSLNYPPVTLW